MKETEKRPESMGEENKGKSQKSNKTRKYWVILDATVVLLCVFMLMGKLLEFFPKPVMPDGFGVQESTTEDISQKETVLTENIALIEKQKETKASVTEEAASVADLANEEKNETETQVSEVLNQSDRYVLPESQVRLIEEDELKNFTPWELRLARNEIYARYGRKFQSQELQDYFNAQSWYVGTIEPDDFNDSTMLNEIEKANLDTIMRVEFQLSDKNVGNDTSTSNQEVTVTATATEVNIGNLGVTDLTPYISGTDIVVLICYGNPVEDFTPIANLTNLKTLDIANTGISDLDSLRQLVQLETLSIGENPISDISVVENFVNLRSIDFWYTDISDISILSELSKLESVYMSYSNVTTLEPLMNLSYLKTLSISGLTIPKAEYDEFVKKHPNCKIYKDGTKFI